MMDLMGGSFNNALICCSLMFLHVRRVSDEVGRICTQYGRGGGEGVEGTL